MSIVSSVGGIVSAASNFAPPIDPNLIPVRAEVRGRDIIVTPENPTIAPLTIPNAVGALGVGPRDFSFHQYDVQTVAPNGLRGAAGLDAVGRALLANATPGVDQPATPGGTRNNVGDIIRGDGDTNFVRSFVVPSPASGRLSDIVVNYTQAGEHALAEGFVVRYAELRGDGSIALRSYGEGNGHLQNEGLRYFWGGAVDRAWTQNHREIFDQALGLR